MAHSTVQTTAGEAKPKHVILVNLLHFFDQIATTTQQLNDCILSYGTLYTETEDSDNLYVELNEPTVLILQDLQNQLESQLRTASMYATVIKMTGDYNLITVRAAEAITMAKIYLGHADLQHDPTPNDQMDIDDTGNQALLEAVANNDQDTQEQIMSTEAEENSPHTQMADLNILQINIEKKEVDLLCPEGENPSETPLTTAARGEADPINRDPTNPTPPDNTGDDDITMATTSQDKTGDDVNLKTIRCDPEGNEEANTPDNPPPMIPKQSRIKTYSTREDWLRRKPEKESQSTPDLQIQEPANLAQVNEQPKLTSCQLYRQKESADKMKKAARLAAQLADQDDSPTKNKTTGEPTTIKPPTPIPTNQKPGPPGSFANSEGDPTIPAPNPQRVHRRDQEIKPARGHPVSTKPTGMSQRFQIIGNAQPTASTPIKQTVTVKAEAAKEFDFEVKITPYGEKETTVKQVGRRKPTSNIPSPDTTTSEPRSTTTTSNLGKAKLPPSEPNMHKGNPPVVTIDQGSPPVPDNEPKKAQPPLPRSPAPKTPTKPMSPKMASSIPSLPPPPNTTRGGLGAVVERTVTKPLPPKKASSIPTLPPPPNTTQGGLGAVVEMRTTTEPRLPFSFSPQKPDTETRNKQAAQERAKLIPRISPKRKTSVASMSSPSEGESTDDLRNRLTDRRNYRASLGPDCKTKRYVTMGKPGDFDQMLRYHYQDQRVRSANSSDYGRNCSDGSGQRTPDPNCERSSSGTRSRSPQWAPRRDRSRRRSSPTQSERDGDKNADERNKMRRGRRIAETLARLPNQRIATFDKKFKGESHDRLPIRSLDERCTAAEQYKRWVSDEPTRGTELLPKLNRWITHFELSRQMPIHTVNLSTEGLIETRWWYEFLVEVKAIPHDKGTVFKDLLIHRG